VGPRDAREIRVSWPDVERILKAACAPAVDCPPDEWLPEVRKELRRLVKHKLVRSQRGAARTLSSWLKSEKKIVRSPSTIKNQLLQVKDQTFAKLARPTASRR
jgi:hypothetical protein